MRDRDVRQALEQRLHQIHAGEDGTVLVHELEVLSGAARIDMAVINGELIGYELKSAADTLERLPRQCDIYNRVFDRISIVLAEKHWKRALEIIPDWWGIYLAMDDGGAVRLSVEREPQTNRTISLEHICWLLWRDEALAILERHEAAKGVRSKPRHALYARMIEAIPEEALRAEIRQAIKKRPDWRGVHISQPCDG